MKVALLCRTSSAMATRVIEEFATAGEQISLVIAERGQRYRLSRTESAFLMAHQKFEEAVGVASRPGPVRRLWRRIPFAVRLRLRNLRRESQGVARSAANREIPFRTVEKHSSENTIALLDEFEVTLALLVQSAWLLKEPLLSHSPLRIVNVHPGKLPEHRSLDAAAWSILEGDPTGVTAHLVDAGIDTGPILKFVPCRPRPGETLSSLRQRLDDLRPRVFLEVVREMRAGGLPGLPQRKENGTHHRPMTTAELLQVDAILRRLVRS